MEHLIAITALAIQYVIVILIVDLYSGKAPPLWITVAIFLVQLGVGFAVWDNQRFSNRWMKLAGSSIILGVGFLGWDALLAYFSTGHANPFSFRGGLLSIPLTLAVCPGCTMICVAGLLKARYLDKFSRPHL